MAKSASPPKNSAVYQKYFDPKSLRNVASCAAMIFIIVHLIDYLWGFSIRLQVLNMFTLSLSLLISFLFVVNEIGRADEKIILGIANAALLFFSVIGFNSTITSNALIDSRSKTQLISRQVNSAPGAQINAPSTQEASLLSFLAVRNWMPPANLERRIDTLIESNDRLNNLNQKQSDSLSLLRQQGGLTRRPYSLDSASMSKVLIHKLDSTEQANRQLQAKLKECLLVAQSQPKTTPSGRNPADSSFMDKNNYINSYKVMKAKFESDLKRCQHEADEYRSKYNILLHGLRS